MYFYMSNKVISHIQLGKHQYNILEFKNQSMSIMLW